MAEGGERRKQQRIRFETRIDLVYRGVSGFASVRTGNLSAGGLFVILSQTPPPGTPVDFGLMVGSKGLHRGTGEVIWSRPAEAAEKYPAGFGLRFVSFQEGSAELVEQYVAEVLAGGEQPTGEDEETAPAITIPDSARVPTAPMGLEATPAGVAGRSASDQTTAVMTLDLPPEVTEAAAGEAGPAMPPPEAEAPSPAGMATVIASVAELAAGGEGAGTGVAAAGESEAAGPPAEPELVFPAMAPTVVAQVAELVADRTPGPPQPSAPQPVQAEGEPQGTTVIDLRQAMADMQELPGKGAPSGGGEAASLTPAPVPPPPGAAPATVAPTPAAAKTEQPPGAGARPEAQAAAPPSGEQPAPSAKSAEAKPATKPVKPVAEAEKPPTAPAKPVAKPEKPAAAAAKPAPSPEAKPAAPAPAKSAARQKPPRRPASRGLLRVAGLVLVTGAVYVVATQTQWGQEATPVALGWVKGTVASVTGRAGKSDTTSAAASPVVAPPLGTTADQIVDVTWEADGPSTRITVKGNGPLTQDAVLHEELSRPPRALIRVKGIRRPFSGFQQRKDVPQLVELRVGHHLELDPPELFVVAEPAEGAKVTGVEVSGDSIVITVATPPTPKPGRRR